MRILIIEDDSVLVDALTNSLRSFGHVVDAIENGAQADRILSANEFEVIILDIELPGMDGFELLTRMRARKQSVPVLMLTAREAVHDRIHGLDIGADDYMTKPFDMGELEARIKALVRRHRGRADNTLEFGDLVINVSGRRAAVDSREIDFAARELAVLEVLAERAGRVVSKEQLMGKIYEWDRSVGPNALEIAVYRIRRKLQDSSVAVRTIRGLGYMLELRKPAAPG